MELYCRSSCDRVADMLHVLTGVERELLVTTLVSRNNNKRRQARLNRELRAAGMTLNSFNNGFDILFQPPDATPSVEIFFAEQSVQFTYFYRKLDDVTKALSLIDTMTPTQLFKIKGRCPCGCPEIKQRWGTPSKLLVYASEWLESVVSP